MFVCACLCACTARDHTGLAADASACAGKRAGSHMQWSEVRAVLSESLCECACACACVCRKVCGLARAEQRRVLIPHGVKGHHAACSCVGQRKRAGCGWGGVCYSRRWRRSVLCKRRTISCHAGHACSADWRACLIVILDKLGSKAFVATNYMLRATRTIF